MLTKKDKLDIGEIVDVKIKLNNEILIKEMVGLFNTVNERIDKSNIRIDKILDKLSDHHGIINHHERRIEKIEEKVFVTTTNP